MNKIKLCISMLIFGTIGVFVKYIPLPSSVIAMARGYMGALFLLAVMFLRRTKPDIKAIKKNLLLLVVSGVAIGLNWILLFEAYKYTSVAVATLCYYMQPVLLILFSPMVLKTKPSLKKVLCVPAALFGMVLVSGIFSSENLVNPVGIALGIGAAVLYTSVILMNRFLKDISFYDSTFVQLLSAAIVITPYNIVSQNVSFDKIGVMSVILLVVVGVFHTGFTYYLYFSSMAGLQSETVAIYSYIDPAFAILLSVTVLGEGMDKFALMGAVLILGATLVSELVDVKKK